MKRGQPEEHFRCASVIVDSELATQLYLRLFVINWMTG